MHLMLLLLTWWMTFLRCNATLARIWNEFMLSIKRILNNNTTLMDGYIEQNRSSCVLEFFRKNEKMEILLQFEFFILFLFSSDTVVSLFVWNGLGCSRCLFIDSIKQFLLEFLAGEGRSCLNYLFCEFSICSGFNLL